MFILNVLPSTDRHVCLQTGKESIIELNAKSFMANFNILISKNECKKYTQEYLLAIFLLFNQYQNLFSQMKSYFYSMVNILCGT